MAEHETNDEMTNETRAWLLAPDAEQPAVRYFALRDLLGRPEADAEVQAARDAIAQSGPVPIILSRQHPDGYWAKPGSGYSPKYRSTDWQIIFLAQLGADGAGAPVQAGCAYLLEHSLAANGAFSAYTDVRVTGCIHCLNGNLLCALQDLGWGCDPRVAAALDWQAHAILGEDVTFTRSGTVGPGFACSASDGRPCEWGAVKALAALSRVDPTHRMPVLARAQAVTAELLIGRLPALLTEAPGAGGSAPWRKFGFPHAYASDLLELAVVLARAGYARDPRLAQLIDFIAGQADATGRWRLQNQPNRPTWVTIERRGEPSKWITLSALRVLAAGNLY